MSSFKRRSSRQSTEHSSNMAWKIAVRHVLAGLFYAAIFAVFMRITDVLTLLLVVPLYMIVTKFLHRILEQPADLLVLESVAGSALPDAARDYFDRHTPELERLGFRLLGDYRLKRRTVQFGRFFINGDGTVFAEIAHLRSLLTNIQTCSFFSVTDSLDYVETGNLRMPKDDKHPRFVLTGISGASLGQLLDEHQRIIADHSTGHPAPICFLPIDLEIVCLYGQKMLYDSLLTQRIVTSNPYAHIQLSSSPDEPNDELPAEGATSENSELAVF